MREYTVKFKLQGKSIKVAGGTDVLSAAIRCGILLNASCGGEGTCGKCKVRIGSSEVLACETLVESDLEVYIPKESLVVHEKLTPTAEEFTKGVILGQEKKAGYAPFVRKVYLELPPPTTDDPTDDLERITNALALRLENVHISARLGSLKHLDELLRDCDYKATCVIAHNGDIIDLVAVEPGDTTTANFALAFDVGTTTVLGQLIDMNTKDILDTRIAFNKQANFGSDVITRIIYGSEPRGLKELNAAILENINEIISEMAHSAKISIGDIYSAFLAGNMTMMHLLLKIDPSNLRKAPYVPSVVSFPNLSSSELGIEINPKGVAAFLPGVATYIGGDIVSGVLACGLAEREEISLLADIGTNGEIVLGNRDWMVGAAASAGPAFEGSGVRCGMKAVKGAIEKVSIDKDGNVEVGVIGSGKPSGICGSGYIDLLCQMLRRGVITKDGRISRDTKSKRIRKGESVYEFVVAFRSESAIDKDIVIDEDDIENLKRSKAAIYSAIIALFNKVGKNIDEAKKVYIAGGFGNYLNIENSVSIGLLPDIRRDLYEFVGNSSLAGARMSLLSQEALRKTDRIHRNITYVDLSSEAGYMDEYVAALFFPHTDLGRFTSVRL